MVYKMNEQVAIVIISILIGFTIGWKVGFWRCSGYYASIIRMLFDASQKGKSDEPEIVRKTNGD